MRERFFINSVSLPPCSEIFHQLLSSNTSSPHFPIPASSNADAVPLTTPCSPNPNARSPSPPFKDRHPHPQKTQHGRQHWEGREVARSLLQEVGAGEGVGGGGGGSNDGGDCDKGGAGRRGEEARICRLY